MIFRNFEQSVSDEQRANEDFCAEIKKKNNKNTKLSKINKIIKIHDYKVERDIKHVVKIINLKQYKTLKFIIP